MSADAMTKCVLVVDDDEAIRLAFRLALQGLPYRLLEADNGETGAEMAIAEEIDLVYLDLRMPRLDGVGALRRIRAAKPDLLVYILSAFERDYLDELAALRGEGLEFEFARKPLDRSQLIWLTRALLGPPLAGGAAHA